jgi:DNA-binding GntR family transcriptional regulator
MKQKASALSAEVFAALKERIIRWEYLPAHRFTEEELSEEFGVSRSPIREALQMLVENGLVTKEPYRGYTVRQPDLKEIHDLYDVRQALELFAVEWLAGHGMPQSEWAELSHTWQNIAHNLPQNMAHFAESDEAFHEKLAECTGNQALVQYLRNIDERLHFVRLTDITTPERLCATCEQHLKILECVRSGDVRCAREAMRQNIEDGRQNVEQAVKEALARSFQNLPRQVEPGR